MSNLNAIQRCRHYYGSVNKVCVTCGEPIEPVQFNYSSEMRRLLTLEEKQNKSLKEIEVMH